MDSVATGPRCSVAVSAVPGGCDAPEIHARVASLSLNAALRMHFRNLSNRDEVAATRRWTSSVMETETATAAEMRLCSRAGGSGIGSCLTSAPEMPCCPAVVRARASMKRRDVPVLVASSRYGRWR